MKKVESPNGKAEFRFCIEVDEGYNRITRSVYENESGEYYIVFTDIDALKQFFPDHKCPHISLFSLYELLLAMMQKDSVPGFIINVNTDTHCFINKLHWKRANKTES